MDADLLLKAAIAVAPVLLLLATFDRLDAFDLIDFRSIALLLAAGAALALASFLVNWRVMEGFPIGFGTHTRYVAPPIEETLKAAPILYLLAANRLGFKLDAAIAGFAVGAGFSVAENLWYLFTIEGANVSAWLVRGFGTAIMHGGATALFAIVSHEMTERQSTEAAARYRFDPLLFAPGLLAAIVVHSAFNHFPEQPLAIMAAALLLLPAVLFLTFAAGERAAQKWLAADRDAHRAALEAIRAGRFAQSDAGRAITALAARLGETRAADALAYVEAKTELVLLAEEHIHASQAGTPLPLGQSERDKLALLDALERKLGRALAAAIGSRLGFSRNDLWELGRLRARLRMQA